MVTHTAALLPPRLVFGGSSSALNSNNRLSGQPIAFYGVLSMIKDLFFTAALLVPGLAYAGNPSADLSVQIVPARSGQDVTVVVTQ